MSPPRRRVTGKALRYEILVFAEGKVTEEGYLRHHHSRNRSTVNVEIHEFRGNPLSLVKPSFWRASTAFTWPSPTPASSSGS
jgi:hypothetical protein